MLRRISIALLGASALVSTAAAGDFTGFKDGPAYYPCYNWCGLYVGVNGGYAWGNTHVHVLPLPSPQDFVYLADQTFDPNASGGVGGFQGGYNWQFGNLLVVGAEGDFQFTSVDGNELQTPVIQANGAPLIMTGMEGNYVSVHEKMDWFATLRARVGTTAIDPQWLVFITGGLALGHVEGSGDVVLPLVGSYPASVDDIRTGWVIGGGVEWAFAECWSFKAEYLHVEFGSESINADQVPPSPVYQVGYSFDTMVDVVRVGVNFKTR